MFSCPTCKKKFEKIVLYNKHQRVHADCKQFVCLYPKCNKVFVKYVNFRGHCNRMHNPHTVKVSAVSNSINYICKQVSCSFQCINQAAYKKHLFETHLSSLNSPVTCDFPRCRESKRTFLTKNAFKVHLFRYHGGQVANSIESQVNVSIVEKDVLNMIVKKSVDLSNVDKVTLSMDVNQHNSSFLNESVATNDSMNSKKNEIENLNLTPNAFRQGNSQMSEKKSATQNLAELYMNLSSKKFANDSCLQGVVEGITSVVDTCSNEFKNSIDGSDFSTDEKKNILNMFSNSFQGLSDAHDKSNGVLRSTYSRTKYYENHYNLIQPIEITFPNTNNEEPYSYHYVPILKTLQKLLSIKKI